MRAPLHRAATLALLLGACDAVPEPDASAPMDAPRPPPLAQTGERGANGSIDPTSARPADYGCLGAIAGLRALVDGDFRVRVVDLLTSTPVTGLRVCAHAGGMPTQADTCDPPGQADTTDEDGEVRLTMPWPGAFGLRVFAGADGAGTSRMDALVLDQLGRRRNNLRIGNWAVSEATMDLLVREATGEARRSGTANVAGQVLDCAGAAVYGVRVRLLRADGSELEAAIAAGYSDGRGIPARAGTLEATEVDGGFYFVNVPIDPAGYRVEAWGRTEPEGGERLLGCGSVPVLPDAVTVRPIWPAGPPGDRMCAPLRL